MRRTRWHLHQGGRGFSAGVLLVVLGGVLLFSSGCTLTSQVRNGPAPAYPHLKDTGLDAGQPIASRFQDLGGPDAAEASALHSLCILNTGDDALLARVHLIRAARRTIDLQTYMWVNDASGRFLFAELLQAARRGVRIRLLDDQFAVAGPPAEIAQMGVAHANLTVKFFKPLFDNAANRTRDYASAVTFRWRLVNERMHNKVMIIDERIGLLGGRNVGNKYFDRDLKFNFKDRDVLVVGPCVQDMVRSFETFWTHPYTVDVTLLSDVARELASLKEGRPAYSPAPLDSDLFGEIDRLANTYDLTAQRDSLTLHQARDVIFLTDPPDKRSALKAKEEQDISQTLLEVCEEAQDLIVFQSPYLILSPDARGVFRRLHRRRPGVRLVFSSNGLASADHLSVFAISWKQRKRVVKSLKFEVYQFKPVPGDVLEMVPRYDQLRQQDPATRNGADPANDTVPMTGPGPRLSLHAKSFVVDSQIAFIGSHNFDPRSYRYNTECGILVRDEAFSRALQAEMWRDMAPQNSWLVARRRHVPVLSYFGGLVASFSAALPVFDIWPFRYTTCYELKEGHEAVGPGHPDFFRNYRNVGQFPEVNSTTQILRTRIIKAMAGFAAPLM